MQANQFVALSFLTALVSLSVINSSQEAFQPIHSISSIDHTIKDKTAEDLQALVKCEMDSSLILSQAIKSVKNHAVKQQLLEFKHGCELRIKELEVLLDKLGLNIPSRTKDATSYLMQGFVAVRGLTGDKGVLKALRLNEKIVLNIYGRALENDLPDNIRPIIQSVYDNTKRHIQYVEDKLNIKAV